MPNKPFMNAEDQVNLLLSGNMTINDITDAKKFLVRRNYYSMINAYGKYKLRF